MTIDVLTVAPYEVEPGDILLGHPHTHVASILCDGARWIYCDADGVIVALRPLDTRVQVIRWVDHREAEWPPPVERHLEVVR